MACFLYTVWFRNTDAEPSDQDYEWNACLVIQSQSSRAAQYWGDHLAKRRAGLGPDVFLSSTISSASDIAELPIVKDGEEVRDDYIGW